ncbi:MAG: hypothetical protein EBU84_10385 [Actinobacteria bacterium]|nr:hypothetical protein [Actinomycetota bacterium]
MHHIDILPNIQLQLNYLLDWLIQNSNPRQVKQNLDYIHLIDNQLQVNKHLDSSYQIGIQLLNYLFLDL